MSVWHTCEIFINEWLLFYLSLGCRYFWKYHSCLWSRSFLLNDLLKSIGFNVRIQLFDVIRTGAHLRKGQSGSIFLWRLFLVKVAEVDIALGHLLVGFILILVDGTGHKLFYSWFLLFDLQLILRVLHLKFPDQLFAPLIRLAIRVEKTRTNFFRNFVWKV